MNSFVPQLAEALRKMWQGRWAGVAVAWVVAIAGTLAVFLTPDRYQATARVYVDTQSVLRPLLHGLTVQPNVEQEVNALTGSLISNPNLEKLVRMTDLDLQVKTPEERQKLIETLRRTVYIKSVGPNLYTIGFASPRPAEATRVVQSLLSIFVESGLSPRAKDTGQALRFIEEQIKHYEQRLSDAENRLKEFKVRNLDLNMTEGRDFFGSMATLKQSLQEARLLLQEAERSRDALKQQITDEEERPPQLFADVAEHAAPVATPELDTRLAALNKNLDDLLTRYTEKHPDVLNTRRIIQEVEAQRTQERKRLAEEQEKRRRPSASPNSPANPVYPQLKLAMAESEAQVARLRARVQEQEQRLAQLRAAARSIPEREAQLTQLNRDYTIQKQNYDALVARRESALISGEAQAATGVADFRIVDPPQVAPNPIAPNRKMLIALVLLASLLGGLGASYGYSLIHPTFHDTRALKSFAGRPTLGTVSLIRTLDTLTAARRRMLAFAAGIGGLATTYAGAVAVIFLHSALPR